MGQAGLFRRSNNNCGRHLSALGGQLPPRSRASPVPMLPTAPKAPTLPGGPATLPERSPGGFVARSGGSMPEVSAPRPRLLCVHLKGVSDSCSYKEENKELRAPKLSTAGHLFITRNKGRERRRLLRFKAPGKHLLMAVKRAPLLQGFAEVLIHACVTHSLLSTARGTRVCRFFTKLPEGL